MNADSTRQQLQKAILIITRRASNGHAPANVNELAIKLSSKYPQSGLTIDEICGELTSRIEKNA